MKFFVDLARDLGLDLAVVTLVLAVIVAAGWLVLGRQDPESNSETVPPAARLCPPELTSATFFGKAKAESGCGSRSDQG